MARSFQSRVRTWLLACFGHSVANDVQERCDRYIEESLELVQSLDYDLSRVAALVAYTDSRPKGDPIQEAGGVMVTLAALCWSVKVDMDASGEIELRRIESPEVMEKIRAKQAAKARDIPFSPLPQLVASQVAPLPGQRWKHTNGQVYTVEFITNMAVSRQGHPPDVVYRGDNGNVWSRPLSDWHRSFTLLFQAAAPPVDDGEKPLRQIGDLVHVQFFHMLAEPEWRPATVISANATRLTVQFHKTGEAMVLESREHGRIWK